MRIVVDTNVVISGLFFNGYPRQVLLAVVAGRMDAFASQEITEEYDRIVQEMVNRAQGKLDVDVLARLIEHLKIIETYSNISVCRDPKDDMFLECAKDAEALFVVSGDNDLLTLKEYEGIRIISARDFCESYLLK